MSSSVSIENIKEVRETFLSNLSKADIQDSIPFMVGIIVSYSNDTIDLSIIDFYDNFNNNYNPLKPLMEQSFAFFESLEKDIRTIAYNNYFNPSQIFTLCGIYSERNFNSSMNNKHFNDEIKDYIKKGQIWMEEFRTKYIKS